MFLKVVFASGMWYSGRLEHANHEKLNGERCFWKLSLHPASDKATASHMPIMRNLTVRCFWKSCLYPAWYSDSLTRQSWETQRWDVFESRLCIRLLMRLRPATEPMFSVQNDILVFQNVTPNHAKMRYYIKQGWNRFRSESDLAHKKSRLKTWMFGTEEKQLWPVKGLSFTMVTVRPLQTKIKICNNFAV